MQTVRRIIVALVALVGAVVLARPWLAEGPEPGARLRVGLLVWPPYEFPFLAEALGEYEGAGIELVDYRSPAEALRAYRSGMIDAVALTVDYLVQLVDRDPGHRAVYVINVSNGGDALVAREGIGTLAELAGRTVGVEASALGAYVLARVLERAGLRQDEIELVAIDVADQEEAFLSGKVEAVITYEPTRSRLLDSGGSVLFDSSEIPGEIVDVLICHRDVLATRRPEVQRLLRGWVRAVAHYRADPLAAAEVLAAREASTPEQFLSNLELSVIPTLAENLDLLSRADSPLVTAMRRSAEVLASMGLVDTPSVGPEQLDASLLQEVAP